MVYNMLIKSELRKKVEDILMDHLRDEAQKFAFNPIAHEDIETLMDDLKHLNDAEFFYMALDQDEPIEELDSLKDLVAKNLPVLIEMRETTVEELAKDVDVPVSYIELMMSGYKYLEDPIVLENIAASLDVNVCDLYNDNDVYTFNDTENYEKLGNLGYGSIFKITFEDMEIEGEEGDNEIDTVTRDFMLINPGPVISAAEPDKVFVVDLDDGVMQAIADKNIEVYTMRKVEKEEE